MNKVERGIHELVGLPVEEPELPALIEKQEVPKDNDAKDDIDFVRNTLHSLLEAGTTAFEDLADIARSEEKVSAFATMNSMLQNLSDISLKLIELHEKKQKILATPSKEEGQAKNVNNVTNNNAVFVGSTSDLTKFLNGGQIYDSEQKTSS